MNLADCLELLWSTAQRELAAKSKRPNLLQGTVKYTTETFFGEGGNYSSKKGGPVIRLWRAQVPHPQDKPDLKTDPRKDACLLAHEYGHFLSDWDHSRTGRYYDQLRDKQADKDSIFSSEARDAILAEEEKAWRIGWETLSSLGCTERDFFDECRERCLKTYRDGLAPLLVQPTLAPPMHKGSTGK